jgi:hypothetical protein
MTQMPIDAGTQVLALGPPVVAKLRTELQDFLREI